MAELTVFAELQKLMGLEQKPGEAAPDFAERLALKGNNLKDDEWESLSEAAQRWVNTALTALEDKDDIPLPDGLIVEEGEEALPEEAAVEEETQEATPAKAKKKSPAKKALVKEAQAKPAKKAAPAKAAKAAKTNGGAKPGPKGTFEAADKIKVLAKENPYREGTKGAGWFGAYKTGMTVQAAMEAGVPRHHLRFDMKHKNISIA